MTTARHVIFGTGAIGLATYDALRRRGESVRLVNRSGHARVPDDVEVISGDARDSAFTCAVAQGAAVLYQTLNPPYHQWTAQWPPLQAGVLAAAQATGARLVSMENVYMYGRPNGRPLTEDRPNAAHTTKGQLRARMAGELLAAHQAGGDAGGDLGGVVMKAFVYEKYGPPETLRMVDVDKPAPKADEVLVRVLATSVNAADWHSMRGKPLFSRATLGLRRPKHQLLGVDVAGKVEAVGSGVTRFKPGDEVYANLLDHGYGGFAEFVSVPVDVMSVKPTSLSFEEAAAVPMAAVTALQGLRHHGEVLPEQKVLINGATGGVGTFAVQIAKSYGAEVTGVTSTRNIELVRALGADDIVDYTTTDFVGGGRRYDLILDTVGNRSVPDLRRALAEGGKAAVTGFTSVAKLIGVALRGGKDIAMVQAHVTTKDLEFLSELIEAGKIRPHVDRRYPFADIPAAIAYLEQGRARGKVVIGVA